ncbi:MAG: hypothetical protein J6R82_04760 [Clostridia bacterium]|nr:hypothetical protein [Clostridia bacterium]
MKKILSILTAALLMGSLFSCSKEPLTPEGMFKTITEAEERRMEMVIVYGEIQTSTTIIEEEGDQSLVRMETESFGASDGDEYYTDVIDGKTYLITETADGTWQREVIGEWFSPASIAGLAELFDDGLYYEEEGIYLSYKSSTVELNGMTLSEMDLKITEDGAYVITAVVSHEVEDMPVYGKATITITLGDVTVQVPDSVAK